jgi:transcriptional regulator with XRE-family HTH domain
MTRRPSDVVAERVRRGRRELGWTLQQLAEECQRLGAEKLTVASLGNIERGTTESRKRRDVTVDEVFVLGYALGVPPLLMMIPLGENEPLEITRTAELHPHLAWQSSTGQGPLSVTGGFITRPKDSNRHLQVIYNFDDLREAQEAFVNAAARLRVAEQHASAESIAGARDSFAARDAVADALPPFAQAVEAIMQRGLDVPAYAPEIVAALQESGIITEPARLKVYEPPMKGPDDGQR